MKKSGNYKEFTIAFSRKVNLAVANSDWLITRSAEELKIYFGSLNAAELWKLRQSFFSDLKQARITVSVIERILEGSSSSLTQGDLTALKTHLIIERNRTSQIPRLFGLWFRFMKKQFRNRGEQKAAMKAFRAGTPDATFVVSEAVAMTPEGERSLKGSNPYEGLFHKIEGLLTKLENVQNSLSDEDKWRIEVAAYLRERYPKAAIEPRRLDKLTDKMKREARAFLKLQLGNSFSLNSLSREIFRNRRSKARVGEKAVPTPQLKGKTPY